MNYLVKLLVIALLSLLGVPNPVASATRSHVLFNPCPSTVVSDPPPCVRSQTINHVTSLDCAAPGTYWFNAQPGFGCAGRVASIKLEMANIPRGSGYQNQYKLAYNLFTGNGFQHNTGGFHIDAILADGRVIRDILGGRIELDFSRCYYGAGQDFHDPIPVVMKFDIMANNVVSLIIRVDRVTDAGRHSHC